MGNRVVLFILLIFISLSTNLYSVDTTGYTYSRTITINYSKVGLSDYYNLEIPLNSTSYSNNFWNKIQSDFGDILITEGVDKTKVKRSVKASIADKQGSILIYVYASSASNTVLTLWWGNSTANEINDSDVCPSAMKLFLRFQDNTSDGQTALTGQSLKGDATISGGDLNLPRGTATRGRFNLTQQLLNTSCSFFAHCYISTLSELGTVYSVIAGSPTILYIHSTDYKLNNYIADLNTWRSDTALSTNSWNFIGINPANARFYINNTNDNKTTWGFGYSGTAVNIGAYSDSNYGFKGKITALFGIQENVSDNKKLTWYNAYSDSSTFYTLGTEQSSTPVSTGLLKMYIVE